MTSSPEATGRAVAVTVLGFFAIAWTGWGIGSHLPAPVEITAMVLVTALSVALVAVAWRSARRSFAAPPPPRADVRRGFRLIVAAEWIVIGVAAFGLGATHHPAQIPAVVCTGVGLHFIPLARLFDVPLYYATAAAMCLVAVATFALAPAAGALWTALPGVGTAVIFYGTCAVLLVQTRRLAVAGVSP